MITRIKIEIAGDTKKTTFSDGSVVEEKAEFPIELKDKSGNLIFVLRKKDDTAGNY